MARPHSTEFNFIVKTSPSEKFKAVLRMLGIFINFLYCVTIYPLILLTFRYKTIQFLDSCSFIDKIHMTYDQNSMNKQILINQISNLSPSDAKSSTNDTSRNKNSHFIKKNKIDSVRTLKDSKRVSFNRCDKFKLNKREKCVNNKFKEYSHIRHNQKTSQNVNSKNLHTHPSLPFDRLKSNKLFHVIKMKMKNFLDHKLQRFVVEYKIHFYSNLNLCDKLENFLEFYNKFSHTCIIDVPLKAIQATKRLNHAKRMEFSNGIAKINHSINLTRKINVSKLLSSFKSLKTRWANLMRNSFAQLRGAWVNLKLCPWVVNKGEIISKPKRTSDYFRWESSNRIKCYTSNLLNRVRSIEWWWQCWRRWTGMVNGIQYWKKYPCSSIQRIDGKSCHGRKYNQQKDVNRSTENEIPQRIFGISTRTLRSVFLIAFISTVPHISASFHHNIKYSMNVVKTKYGPLRGIVVRSSPTVEAFLGVPYASPPVGSLRYMPPVTPSTWRSTRLADRFSAVCPQVAPVAPSGPEALLEVPRGRLAQLRRLLPLLANQSEDCLYLNLYVPRALYPTPAASPSTSSLTSSLTSGASSFSGHASATGPSLDTSSSFSPGGGTNSGSNIHNMPNDAPSDENKPLPAILYIHGESYEWNSGNPYDGSVLAAHGNVIVVTINFRLGVLGFLKTGGKGSAQGNFGLMDLVAGLHWLRENLPAFGGDPNKVTVMGHGTGAALANILIVSPVASDLVHRAVLISGSALSPWAIQKDPIFVKRRVAEHTGCHGDLVDDDLAPCLRTKSIAELLAIKIDSPRFLPGFAPFIDGTVIVHPTGGAKGPLTLPTGSAIASTSGIELADFPNRELIFGLTTIESYLDLSAQDLEFGFNETRRDRILRTYVRNVYHYHLNEIYAALKNEYTDWERPVRNPMGSRDASLEFLSDGHTAAPLIRLGYLHSLRGGRSYFLHFRHQSGERDFPQRGGSVRGEDVPFCLGLPISPLFPHNYTKQDIKISRIMIRYLTNFALTGNPNEKPTASVDISHIVHNSKMALVSSSLSLAPTFLPRSSPPSMSLVKVQTGTTKTDKFSLQGSFTNESRNSTISTSLSSLELMSIPKTSLSLPDGELSSSSSSSRMHNHALSSLQEHQLSSLATSSIPTSVISSTSSVDTSRLPSLSAVSSSKISMAPVLEQHYHDPSLSSSSKSPLSVSSSYHESESKDATVFIAPPAHTVIKSKRHAVAAHRRKRKTSKRLPNLQQQQQQQRQQRYMTAKKTNNYRKKFLGNGNDRVNQNFGTSSSSSVSSSALLGSSSFLADEGGLVERRGGHGIDPEEIGGGSENEEDEDDEEINSEEEHPDPGEENDEDDADEHNGNTLRTNKKDDEDNNSEDIDENGGSSSGSEKFDRFGSSHFNIQPRLPFWDTYDAINQLYLELGNKVEVKNHYRGHKLSMWLSLIPQLHSPGDLSELPMRHHHFMEDSAQYYDGIIRPQIMQRPTLPKQSGQQQNTGSSHRGASSQSGSSGTTKTTATTISKTDHPGFNVGIPATTECPPNTTIVPTIAATRPQNHQQQNNNNRGTSSGSQSGVISDPSTGVGAGNAGVGGNKQDTNLFRRLASSQFQSYTTALTVTIAVGCFLLLLNILIFAGIYYQREKRATDAKKKELLREAENLCSSTTNLEKLTAGEGAFPGGGGGGIVVSGKGSRKSSLQSLTAFNTSVNFGEYSCYDEKIQCKEKHALADICSVELPMKEFKCSGSPNHSNTGSLRRQPAQSNQQGSNNQSSSILIYPPSYHHPVQPTQSHKSVHHYPSPDRKNCPNSSDLVTYEQFQKPQTHPSHFHQGHSHQGHHHHHQSHTHQATSGGSGGGSTSSSTTVGTSTEQCNQSTQSEQPKVQDVATSIDEKAMGGLNGNNDGNGSERGSTSGGGGSTISAGTNTSINDTDNMISPGIPEPPPPPKSSVPYQGGILRQPGPPTTPSSNKKRVQIQEISV